jgi:hypothetical protein
VTEEMAVYIAAEVQGTKTIVKTGVLSPVATLRHAYTDELNVDYMPAK